MLMCKILGHKIDEVGALITGEIECQRCNQSTNIGKVDYTWLNQGLLKKLKNGLQYIKFWYQYKALRLFVTKYDDLPF